MTPIGTQTIFSWRDVRVRGDCVTRDGQPVHLTPKEQGILLLLIQNPEKVFTQEQILDAVWGHDVFIEPTSVNRHVRELRSKLGKEIIKSVRPGGFTLGDE